MNNTHDAIGLRPRYAIALLIAQLHSRCDWPTATLRDRITDRSTPLSMRLAYGHATRTHYHRSLTIANLESQNLITIALN
ncbi:MAG: hypothetical protein F6J90_26740 [Moorea sp. SIOASIH]|uniref:hypothetical protein n=1 Tax=Moorena sp. SIOASIH TaxID=2607817 RepID=UPI0013B9D69C|nr:hypothetical protein [Moorena sp. SIOASIH]NEO39731.1 hypothetical protein [Moorena sp. SIOASIH]